MFWVSSDSNSGKKVRVFHFLGGGVFWVRPDLDSSNNFNWVGGVLEPNSRTGVFWRIWSKFSGSLAGWCITDSLSHTTYVETNEQCSECLVFIPVGCSHPNCCGHERM